MKIAVLGASGMLGHAMVSVISKDPSMEVIGTVRSTSSIQRLSADLRSRCHVMLDVESQDQLVSFFTTHQPDVVVNCIGLVKQLAEADNPLSAIPINALLPHQLAKLCALTCARLVHISTDCVFSGRLGDYKETDDPDAMDLYGRSKLLGEVVETHTITLRTSIIGHELNSNRGLIDWFLAQEQSVRGYTRAIFSGLPTFELARVVRDFVLPLPKLHGLFHVAAQPISKYELLSLVKQEYRKDLLIQPDEQLKINRSLNASRFQEDTGYIAPPWPQLVAQMHEFYLEGQHVQ